MDKYQRRLLRKMDENNGRMQDSVDRYIKKLTLQEEHKQLREAMRNYRPCPEFFFPAVRMMQHGWWLNDFDDERLSILLLADGPLTGSRIWGADPYGAEWGKFVWDKDMIGIPHKVNMEKTIERHKTIADIKYIHNEVPTFYRTVNRTKLIADDIAVGAERMRAILRCHAIKEELYQNVYHPRRIEKLLEHGGWDALENFAGL